MLPLNPFITWLMSPLSQWSLTSLQHKLIAGAAGAGTAWYLHKYRQWPTWKVAVTSVGVAYGVSLLLHTLDRFSAPALAAPIAAPAQMPPMTYPFEEPQVKTNQGASTFTPAAAASSDPYPTESAPANDYDVDEGMAGDEGIFD